MSITHVALRFKGKIWSLPAPNRHHHVIRMIVEQAGVSYVDCYGSNEGFLDNDGNYLTRTDALFRAQECGQLNDRDIIGGQLYSENLW